MVNKVNGVTNLIKVLNLVKVVRGQGKTGLIFPKNFCLQKAVLHNSLEAFVG